MTSKKSRSGKKTLRSWRVRSRCSCVLLMADSWNSATSCLSPGISSWQTPAQFITRISWLPQVNSASYPQKRKLDPLSACSLTALRLSSVLISAYTVLSRQCAANTAQLYGSLAKHLLHTAVTFPVVRSVPNYTARWQRHICANNLPRAVTWQWNGRKSNQRPRDH